MREQIVLGVTPVVLNNPTFVQGAESGLECYFSEESPTLPRSTKDLCAFMIEATIREVGRDRGGLSAPDDFRMGFTFGWLCGLLHPHLVETDAQLTWVEALSAHYETPLEGAS